MYTICISERPIYFSTKINNSGIKQMVGDVAQGHAVSLSSNRRLNCYNIVVKEWFPYLLLEPVWL